MTVEVGQQDFVLEAAINGTDLPANTSQEIVSCVDGYLEDIRGIVQAAVTTGGTIKVQINGVDVATAAANILTVANGAAKGSRTSGSFALIDPAKKAIVKGDRITLVPASFASAGAMRVALLVRAAQRNKAQPF